MGLSLPLAPLTSFRRSRYRWDPRTAQYIDPRGRFVSRLTVRRELDRVAARLEREAVALGEQLRAQLITVDQWELAMRELVKDAHLTAGAAAKGGWAQLSSSDYGGIGRVVRDEYRFLRAFAQQVQAGYPLDGRFLQRIRLYAKAGRETYHRVERRAAEAAGNTEERSIRHSGDSCPGCVEEAAKGWVPIGTLRPVGTRDCLRNCRCAMRYRK